MKVPTEHPDFNHRFQPPLNHQHVLPIVEILFPKYNNPKPSSRTPHTGLTSDSRDPVSLEMDHNTSFFAMMHSKVSCQSCRLRKVRCDKILPHCFNCTKKLLACDYPGKFRNKILEEPAKEPPTKGKAATNFYYGPNSSYYLETTTKRATPIVDSATAKMYPIPVTIAKLLMELMFSKLRDSSMWDLYSEFVDLGDLWLKIADKESLDAENILMLYGIVMLSTRFVSVLEEARILEIKESFFAISAEAPLSIGKVTGQMLFCDFFYYRFEINQSFRILFMAVADAYALGIHRKNHKAWRMLTFFDAIICSCVGRPTSIYQSFLTPIPEGTSETTTKMIKAIELVRKSNNEMLNLPDMPNYNRILALDTEHDIIMKELEEDDHLTNQTLVGLLLTNQLKLHYSFHLVHEFSDYKLKALLCKFLIRVKLVFVAFKRRMHCKISKGIPLDFRANSVFFSCFSYQALLILLAYISKKQSPMPEISGQVEQLMMFVRSRQLIEHDSIFVEILEAIRGYFSEIGNALYHPSMEAFPDLNLQDPQFYQDFDIWSNLAVADIS